MLTAYCTAQRRLILNQLKSPEISVDHRRCGKVEEVVVVEKHVGAAKAPSSIQPAAQHSTTDSDTAAKMQHSLIHFISYAI